MIKSAPAISVVMPVYNGGKYLHEAIDSILNQSFIDFECLIINDGSTDHTENIILEYASKDRRIKYHDNGQNLGLVKTLNRGLELATGTYIARMDADDICHRERFDKQISFMDENPEVMICGTSYETFGSSSATHILPLSHESIKAGLLFGSCICHPSVFFRKSFVKETNLRYLADTFPAEDYKIWVDAIKVARLHNLPEVLLYYREHATQISTENEKWQKEQTDKIRLELLDWLYPGFTNIEKHFHLEHYVPVCMEHTDDPDVFKAWTKKLLEMNNKTGKFDPYYLRKKLKIHLTTSILRWVHKNYFQNDQYNIGHLRKYVCSGLFWHVALKQNLKIFLKSIIS